MARPLRFRWLTWSRLLSWRRSGSVVAILFALAFIADALRMLGATLPLRTKVALGGAIALGIGSALVWLFAPATVKASRRLRDTQDHGGATELLLLWKMELQTHRAFVSREDALRTLNDVRRRAQLTLLPPDASYDNILASIDDFGSLPMTSFSVHARETFEHVNKSWQVGMLLVYGVGAVAMAVAIVMAVVSVYS